jgi:acyl CoA:acetate/3-ketoacid CoA transferase beta subunit
MVISDLAVLARPARNAPFKLIELAPAVSLDDLRSKTEGHFEA